MSSQPIQSSKCASCGLSLSLSAQFCPGCGTRKASNQEDPLLGTVVGDRYRLLKKIGEGNSGVIFESEHVNLNRPVAVKVLHAELSGSDMSVEKFRREATSVSDIANQHIVEVFDFGKTKDDRLYMAMELLRGEPLAKTLAGGKILPCETVVDILDQLCDALMEAHAMGYVHRDLRPENIFLANQRERDGFVKLLDFGLAKLVESNGAAPSTRLGMTFGDPSYMSPEQAQGNSIDRRADIYSLGCVAYQALTGAVPHVGNGAMAVLAAHVQKIPVSPKEKNPSVPDWLNHVVMNMLEKDPAKRFVTVFRLQQALKQGEARGEIMPSEMLRRAESHPPPSVSRAMAKLSERASSENDLPASEPSEGQPGHIDEEATEPNQSDPAFASEKHRQPIRQASPGLSGAWYADGDALSEGDNPSDSVQGKLWKARGGSGASYRIPGESSEYLEPASKARWWRIPLIALAVFLLAGVAYGAIFGGDSAEEVDVSDGAGLVGEGEGEGQEAPNPNNGKGGDKPGTVVSAEGKQTAEKNSDEVSKPLVTTPKPGSSDSKPKNTKAKTTKPKTTKPKTTNPKTTNPKTTKPKTTKPKLPPKTTSPPLPVEPKPNVISDADKSRADFFAKLGASALKRGDTLEAATQFNEARKVHPNNARALAGLGEIALSQGAGRAAVKHLNGATRAAPGNSRYYTLLGQAHLQNGDRKKASASFERALRLDPDNDEARRGFNDSQ